MLRCIYTLFDMSFTPIGDSLQDKIQKNTTLKNQVELSAVLELVEGVLAELFGADLSKHAKPLFLKNRTITISCTSSAMAQEIRLNQAEIVSKINGQVGSDVVDRIRYLA